MKKIVLSVIALLLVLNLSAQGHWGIKAGVNLPSDLKVNTSEARKDAWGGRTGWHAGLVLQANIPGIGLSFQPELLYSTTKYSGPVTNSDMEFSHLELPVNILWGIDLLLLRPFVVAAPYINYCVKYGEEWMKAKDLEWNDFGYGFGLGAGIEIWKLQIMGKYNWSLGNLSKVKSSDWGLDKSKLNNFQLSIAILF